MHDTAIPIAFVGLLIFLAHLFTGIFKQTKAPDVLMLIAIGILLGPILGQVGPEQFGAVGPFFTTLTLIMILFEGGLHLDLKTLAATWRSTLSLTMGTFVISVLVTIGLVIQLFDMAAYQAILLALIISSTAPSVIVPMIRTLKMTRNSQSVLFLEAALSEVLSIVLVIGMLEYAVAEDGTFTVGKLVGDLLSNFLISALIGTAAGLAWSISLTKIRRIKNSIFTTPAFAFVVFGLVEWIHGSGPIAALTFGITLGNVEVFHLPGIKRWLPRMPVNLNRMERIFFREAVFLMKTFFFVFIGLSMQWEALELLGAGLVVTAAIFLGRVPVARMALPKTTPTLEAGLVTVMACKGLAPAVLAALPVQLGMAGAEQMQQVTFSIILASILATSFGIFALNKTGLGSFSAWIFTGFGQKMEPKEAAKTADKE